MQRPRLTELQLVPGELPLLTVGQLGRVDEGVAVAFVALNDLPAHLVLGLLLGGGLGKGEEGSAGSARWVWDITRPRRTGAWRSHCTVGGGGYGLRFGERGRVPHAHGTESPVPVGLALPRDHPFSKPWFP